MQQGAVVHRHHGHDLQIIVLAGNGSQCGTGAKYHALLVGGVHVDHAGGGRVDEVIVGAGVQRIQLRLQVIHVDLCAGNALGDGLHGRVVQRLQLALVLLHQSLDLGVGVTGSLIGGGVKGLLRYLAFVGLVLVVVGLVLGIRLVEVVGVVLNALEQLVVLIQLLLVDIQLALQVILLHIQIGALQPGDQVALIHIAALRDIQLGDGAGVAGHDVGLVGGLHHTAVLADIDAVGLGAPDHQKNHEQTGQNDKSIPVGGQLFVHHDPAVLQIRKVLNGCRHNYLVSINTSITASSSS